MTGGGLRWSLALLAGVPAGCQEAADIPSAQDLAEFPVAYASLDCAPWDGPAMSILLTKAGDTTETVAGPFVRVAVYGSLQHLVATTIRWPSNSEVGAASWCLAGGGECVAAAEGVVRLGSFAADSTLSGRLRIRFPDGRMLEGAFRATWRPRAMLCG